MSVQRRPIVLERRTFVLIGIGVVLAVVLLIVLRGRENPESVPVSGNEIYYTGPRRSKANPNIWVTADGKVVPPPPGAQQVPTAQGGGQLP